MFKSIKIGLVFMLVFACSISYALAANRNQKRDQNRDGSCQSYSTGHVSGSILAADQERKRDQKKDGSCQSYSTGHVSGSILAADQERKRDQKKDGSCQS